MIKKNIMKKCLAGILSFAMTVTLLPANALGTVQAAEDGPKPVLHYDMSHADGKLTDISGNHLDGKLQGITDDDFVSTDDGMELKFANRQMYVEIPAGVIKNGGSYASPSEGSEEAFTIEATYTNKKQSTAWLFTLGTTVTGWPKVFDYLFVAPNSGDGKYAGKMLAAIKDGYQYTADSEGKKPSAKEYRYAPEDSDPVLQGDNDGGRNVVTVVFDRGKVTYYLNGKKSSVTDSKIEIQKLLQSNSTEDCIGYIGRSLYNGDANFEGTLLDFKIYDQAMTEEEVGEIHESLAKEKAIKSVKAKLLSTMLNKNENVDQVTSDLSFPAEMEGISLTWTPSDTALVSAQGKLLYDQDEARTLTVTVVGKYNNESVIEETYTIKVISADGAEYDNLTIHNMDNIKGNITLPAKGANGSAITWASEKENVISAQAQGEKPAGVVNRQSADTKVKLTATIKQAGGDKTKEFNVTVKAKANVDEMTDYVFAYFAGDGEGEQIFLASSRDGLNWEELNGGEPVLKSELGTKGLRDPYILRSPEGDKFYLVATDLSIAATNWDWDGVQKRGSQAVMVWESDDLVHWTNQRMAVVSAQIEAGCTWAPEVFYDDTTGEYMLFWSSKVKSDNYAKQRVYYCKTRDFYTFTEPQIWIENSFSTIDTTVIRGDDGKYYRFSKNEAGDAKYIYEEVADTLLGEWKGVGWTTEPKQIGKGEGPSCFRFNDDDQEEANAKYCLLIDDFSGIRYYPMITKDLASGEFTDARNKASLPKKPCHGTVMNITTAEYEALESEYGRPVLTKNSLPNYVTVGYTLPDKIEVQYAGQIQEVEVIWDKTAEDFSEPGTVTVTGTIPSIKNSKVTKSIEVIAAVSKNLIYFIDSGVGSWNADLSESGYYNAVGAQVDLRNAVPDQIYTEGSWGFVNEKDEEGQYTIAGNRTSSTDSIYTNGWWAKDGKVCEYILPLENGSYKATGYFAEWWGVTRPVKFYAKYKDASGTDVTTEAKTITLKGDDANQTAEISFEISGLTEAAEVHFYAENPEGADETPAPVIAGLSVEKNISDEEAADLEAKKEAAKASLQQVTAVPAASELFVKDSEQIEVTYPQDLEQKAQAANLSVSTNYVSDNPGVASVDNSGKITAIAKGKAVITTTVAISSKIAKKFTTEVTVKERTVTGITLDESELSMRKGEKVTLKATIAPENATNKEVTWTSSDPEVASVKNGEITALTAGNTTITATASNGMTAECEVTVIVIEPESVTLDQTALSMKINGTAVLTAVLAPETVTEKELDWESSDSETVSVTSGTGNTATLKAKKVGTATITVKTANNKTAVCQVTVRPDTVEVAGITLNKTQLSLTVGGSEVLTVTFDPANADDKTVKWESKDPQTASVDNAGKVTAVKVGTTEITATTANGKTAVCKVTVNAAGSNVVRVTKVTLNKKKLTLGKGETFTLKATVTPKNATNKTVTWTSSKPGIVSVGKTNGKLKAKKTGKAVITAAVDGKTVKCNVTVKKAPAKIQKLNKTKVTLKKGKTFKIKVTLPKNTASNTIKYKSSNKKVATVDANGKIKAKKKGKATITVTTFNKKKKTLKVTVK